MNGSETSKGKRFLRSFKMKELTKDEEKIIRSFKKLAKKWPKRLMIFGWSGTLIIADMNTGQIYPTNINIVCDGGDPDSIVIDGVEYIKHLKLEAESEE